MIYCRIKLNPSLLILPKLDLSREVYLPKKHTNILKFSIFGLPIKASINFNKSESMLEKPALFNSSKIYSRANILSLAAFSSAFLRANANGDNNMFLLGARQ